jgi:hypothetical protein
MVIIDGPAIIAYCNIKAPVLNRLNDAAVMRPAHALQVIQIEEQIEVAFVRLDVVNDC